MVEQCPFKALVVSSSLTDSIFNPVIFDGFFCASTKLYKLTLQKIERILPSSKSKTEYSGGGKKTFDMVCSSWYFYRRNEKQHLTHQHHCGILSKHFWKDLFSQTQSIIPRIQRCHLHQWILVRWHCSPRQTDGTTLLLQTPWHIWGFW